MEKTIKYLENGEYHYATVRDVGDLAKLKTDSKDDLVTAINELFITGGEAPKNPDGYDELVDNVADAIQKQQQMTDTITNMQQSAQLSDAEMEHMKQVQEELHQEYLKAIKELNEAVDKAKADAADLDKKTSDLQDKLDETFASVDKEVSDVHKQLDSESAGLRKDLDDTKTSLESTRKDLLNNTQEFGVVNSEVKELKDKMDRRIWSTDLDPVREQVNKNTTEVSQTKDELKNKADQSSLDLVTNSVENLSTQVKENADGLKVSVKKDELGGDVARLLNDKTNLLLGTRSFSGEDNWKNRDTVTIEPGYYKGLKSAAVQVLDASIYQPYRVKANTAYTFSFFGKEDRDNPKATLVIKPIDAQNINVDGGEQQVHITTEWQRFAVTFSVDQECEISIQIIQGPEATNNILHLAGLKLQYGQNDTPWEPNEADIAENIEHTESQFNVYSDQIAGIVKKQEKMGDTERQLDTRITETAEGLKQTSKDLQDANGKITEFKGQLESTAKGLKTEYEKYTNEAIGQISDSSLNLIHNSAFSSQDNQFESWQNISAKATVREDSNDLHWVELTQSGQGTDNPIGVTSNYFIVKQGKVTVAVDIKLGDKANLDNQNILLLELYNDNKQRVDFTDVSVSQLGLSTAILNDHSVHRGLYRLGIDRKDVKYMTVKAILHRNGDLWFTNFSARLSSIDDGGYTPNPDDVNQQILKQNTKIEQDAKQIALKANSVDVTRDIKSAVDGIRVGGVNLIPNSGTDIVIESKTTDAYPQWDNHLLYSSLQSNTTYTFSVSATNTNGVEQASVRIFKDSLDGKYLNKEAAHWYFNADGKRHNFTFTTPNDAIPYDIWLYAGPMGTLQGKNFVTTYHHPQLELGNKSTSWSPAPEDTSAEIKSAKDAAIQVASDQINLHVNELSTQFDDKLNKRVNEVKTASEKFTSDGIEQTVSKITEVKNNVDNLNKKVDSNNGGGINLQKGTKDFSFQIGTNGNPSSIETYNSDTKMLHIQNGGFYTSYSDSSFVPTPGEFYTFSADVKGDGTINGSGFRYEGGNNGTMGNVTLSDTWQRIINTVHVDKVQGQWVIYPSNSKNLYVKHIKIERGTVATPWTAAPEDVESTHTLDTANIDEMKTQGHYFVKNLTGNPIGGWVYVDVTGNNNDRIRQDVYQDNGGKHMSRRLFGNSWSGWEQGAYLSDVNNTKTEVTASVKNLGDRVTTEVNSVTSKINNVDNNVQNQFANAVELIQKSDFSDGSKGNWTVQSIISATNPAPPAELGIPGMKVIQSNIRDSYEDVWHSVTPGEKFNVDFWCAPSSMYDSSFGLVFYDANKKLVPSNQWLGVHTDHSAQWKHYTGEITAPGNSAFAKPWFQIDMPADQHNTSWLAKPHIRRQDPRVTEAISEVNTKWDVANGQIQGKVTATDVNNILNGKGYATQSWAQSQFRMKSDSIDLEVRKITDPISNKINNLQVGGRNLLANSSNDISVTSHTTDGYPAWANIDTGFSFEHGKMYTFSAEAKNSTDKIAEASIRVFEYSTNTQVGIYAFPADGERHSVTFTIPNDSHDYHLLLYAGHAGIVPGVNVTTTFHHPKLELGNVATDWSPAPEDTTAEIKSAKDTAINVANDKVNASSKELQGKIDDSNKELQGIKDITQWHTVSGPIDLNDLKTQTRIFYRDIQDKNSAVTGWQYIVVDSSSDKVTQTVWKDNSTIQYIRQFTGAWSNWVRQTNQNDIDEAKTGLREEIKSAKDAAIQVASDQINIHVNELTTSFDDKLNKRVNEVKTASEKFTSDGIEQVVTKVTNVKNDVDRLDQRVATNNGGGINLLRGTGSEWKTLTGSVWFCQTTGAGAVELGSFTTGDTVTYSITVRNNSQYAVRPEIVGFSDDNGTRSFNISGTESVQPGETKTVSVSATVAENTVKIIGWLISSGAEPTFSVDAKNEKLERGSVATPWSPNPQDAKTYTDSQIVNTNKKIDTQTLDSANIDQMKTQGHYFVNNLTGNPIGGWVYVDVTGNNNDRVRQDVYQDTGGKHMYRRLFGNSWSGWEQGAYISDVNNVKTEVTASVKNLGDRVTTEVNSITKMVNSINGGGVNLLRGTADFRPDNIWFPLELWTRTNEAYNGLTIFKDHEDNDWYGLTQYYSVKAGETYTFSLNARYESGSGSSTLFIMLNGDPENGHKAARVSPVTRDITLNEDWQRYSFTFTVNSDGYIKPRIERTSNNKNVLEICGFKLERGPVATPWTPAPEDTADQIKQLNTKWEVANGQIQGKVTETDVNNILNGKGYVTQSWAQTMFQMKSDSITLQTVRDNITNGIQNQVNGINKKIDTQILDSANIDQMKTQGHYFVKNLTGNPIGGWVYVDVNCADQWRIRQDVYQDIGGSHVYRRLDGSSWTEWTTDVNNKNIISQINITPDQIKIASNKIVLDGDTEIKGTAFIPSAAIKDITADKITTGTLSGITIRAGDEDGFFQTSEDNIYWITNSGGSAVIGKGKYVQYPGLNVFDNNAVYLGSWAGAELNKDGTINDYGGAIGNPKLAIETGGMRRRFNVDSWGGEFEDKPLDNNRIISWVGNKEFLSVERENGTHIELNPDINGSQFTVQKDDKFGAYFGQGRDGNEINFTPIGGMTINGNFRVTGAKNAIVKTSQGTVAINAYETAGYFFGDIGSAKTSDNKVAMIDIESLFKETVNTDVEYQVFLTSYGPGDIWVSERQRDYFVVESELPNMEFGWEIKAKRKGYENTRLAKVDVSNVPTV